MKIKECIQKIVGRSIFDSRGVPTVEIDMQTVLGKVRASCPSGASTGSQEALEIRDGDMSVCMGKGVQKALIAVEEIASLLITKETRIIDQKKIDGLMVELDGTENKSRLGANSILPISVCFARLGALYMGMEDWMYLRMLINDDKAPIDMQSASSATSTQTEEVKRLPQGGVVISNTNTNNASYSSKDQVARKEMAKKIAEEYDSKYVKKEEVEKRRQEESTRNKKTKKEEFGKDAKKTKISFPKIFFNVINGGAHADNGLFAQEIMVSFEGSTPYKVLTLASEFIHTLKIIVKKEYKLTGVGDEGGFAPPVSSLEEALDLIQAASKKCGIKPVIALDVAASEFYQDGKYNVGWKTKSKLLTSEEMVAYYLKIIDTYKISMIEDPFDEKDYAGWKQFMKAAAKKSVQVVGDDLIVTNKKLIKKAGEEKLCNVALIKMNQIGTVSETIEAVKEARKQGMKVMASHRSGETEDTFLAHLSVGLAVDYLKAGSLCRTERVCKYNELVRIFEKSKIDTI
ncbi:enolase [Nematocida minor]|uniref:enolase n=1 Tax=Nematocida minor TaxID=1912983 RepID=UPI0022201B15|nr:enolase [Nematocida minor]KAI5191903.1 enolase [Nematocida minor]